MACTSSDIRTVFDSTTLQAVAANGLINMPDVTTDSKCNTSTSGVVTLRVPGTYAVHANVTVSATAAGPQEVQLIRNGAPVPGAHALETAAAIGDLASMAFTTLITVPENSSVTLALRSATAANIRVAALAIER